MSRNPSQWRWFVDWGTPWCGLLIKSKEILYSGRTRYQQVDIVESEELGRCLILDGAIQSSTSDERIYHEALVHPGLLSCSSPRRVMVIGGGEGATIREILRHRSVEKVVMIDIDEELIELTKRYLPQMHEGSFEDSRVELVFEDGKEYLRRVSEDFDGIILDATDPNEGGPSQLLYTKEFYQLVFEKLSEEGVVVTQATSPFFSLDCFSIIHHTMEQVFSSVGAYCAPVRTFGGLWGFVVASKAEVNWVDLPELEARLEQLGGEALHFYNSSVHRGLFALPNFIRRALEGEERVATDQNKVYMPV